MKIFIAGPRAISGLTPKIKDRLYGIYEKGYSVLVGDASGVDNSYIFYHSIILIAQNCYHSGFKRKNPRIQLNFALFQRKQAILKMSVTAKIEGRANQK